MATRKQSEEQGTPSSAQFFSSLSEMGLRGAAQLVELQVSAAQALWEMRARTASAFGWPDYARAFAGDGEDRVRQVLQTTTEQLIDASQQTGEAIAKIQSQARRLVESQAQAAAENWQQALEQLGARAAESMQQICAATQQQADQFGRVAQVRVQETQAALQQAAEQLSQVAEEGARRGAEALARAADSSLAETNGAHRQTSHASHEANGRKVRSASA
jgi:hypothetical protein